MEFNFTYNANISCNVSVDVDEEAYKEQFIEECMDEDEEFDVEYFESWLHEKVESEMCYGYVIRTEEYANDTVGFEINNEPEYMMVEIEYVDCGEVQFGEVV